MSLYFVKDVFAEVELEPGGRGEERGAAGRRSWVVVVGSLSARSLGAARGVVTGAAGVIHRAVGLDKYN